MTLAFAPLGQQVKVLEIKAEDKTKRQLENIGLGAGSTLTAVSDSGGNVILQVKDGRVAINRGLAMKILVCGA